MPPLSLPLPSPPAIFRLSSSVSSIQVASDGGIMSDGIKYSVCEFNRREIGR